MPDLELPAYFSYYKSPVKMVSTPDGGLVAWRLSIDTGGWEPATDLVDEILFAVGGEISVLTVDQFVQRTEYRRGRYTVKAIADAADAERRRLTIEEAALIKGIHRRTFVMFEEQLQQAGDPGADPTIATAVS